MANNTPADGLTFSKQDGIAVITLDRPQARNAITAAMREAMEVCVADVERDADIRVAVLTSSSPGAFCVGADIKEIAAGNGPALISAEAGFFSFVRANRSKPWIAAVGGYAVGGGLEIALACDIMVVGEGAILMLPEAQQGMLAGAGGAFRLARLLPPSLALEVLLAGRRLSGAEAVQHGIASTMAPDDGVTRAALALAEKIIAAAPIPVEETLKLSRLAREKDEAELWTLSTSATRRIMASEDVKEGTRAFLEKRKPRWTGR
ncbi:MAG: enoyl-CoA hydratase-related protein [Novosphingobium sp.]|nr:enoyl-CoA hydratase-related protein [Novosphingobium sp.]